MDDDTPLSARQEEYFRLLRKIDPSAEMERVIEETKEDIRNGDKIVRGVSRLRGFTPNPPR